MSLSKYDLTPEEQEAALSQTPTGGSDEKKDYSDPRMFKPSIRDATNVKDTRPDQYQALVRILPRGMEKSKPFAVEVQEHFYSENRCTLNKKCRKTFGRNEICPVCDAAWKTYNLGKDAHDEALMKVAKKRLPKTHYYCNVYVIKDAITPANNGKVMLWKMTKNMYEIIVRAMKPQPKAASAFAEEGDVEQVQPFVPYHPITGRNLIVDLVRDPKTGFPSYEGSEWHNPKKLTTPPPYALAATEQEIDAILAQCNDLTEFTADILPVDLLAQEVLKWQTRVSAANMGVEAQASMGSIPVGSAPPNMAQVAQGNSGAFFGVPGFNQAPPQAQAATATAVAPTLPVQAPVAPVMQAPVQAPIQAPKAPVVTDEDDLPF